MADSQRRASSLADFAGDRVHLTEDLAGLNELNTYLSSKALGMSPLYGLNASLDALERKFRDRTAVTNPVARTIHGKAGRKGLWTGVKGHHRRRRRGWCRPRRHRQNHQCRAGEKETAHRPILSDRPRRRGSLS